MSDNTCKRRTFLKGAGLMALAAAGGVRIPESHAQEKVPWSSGTDLPKLKAPANSCDCHMHIYDARFPADPGATLRDIKNTLSQLVCAMRSQSSVRMFQKGSPSPLFGIAALLTRTST